MAAYAALVGLEAYVFVPAGKIAYGKLSQALAFGAKTLQLDGDFDSALALVRSLCRDHGIYLLNSVNPFRLEGQKAIGFEILSDLDWQVPDWIVLPGGNLGNSSALGKGLYELRELGLIDRLPRIAVIQAAGAAPLYQAWVNHQDPVPVQAETIATAIRIGDPVSWRKSLRAVEQTGGLVERVSDEEILAAKAQVDRAGIGAEPASCATVAGIRKLVLAGTIRSSDHVVGILTGHLLKDPDVVVNYHRSDAPYANPPVAVDGTVKAVLEAMGLTG
jgi:threonine synthase